MGILRWPRRSSRETKSHQAARTSNSRRYDVGMAGNTISVRELAVLLGSGKPQADAEEAIRAARASRVRHQEGAAAAK